jgi:hypothetical protein
VNPSKVILETETAASDSIELSWNAETHLIRTRFIGDVQMATARDAAGVIDHTRRWIARPDTERYGFLVDCAGVRNGDVGFRTTMADHFRTYPRGSVFVAWYNLHPITRVMVEMFAVATLGANGKAFVSEPAGHAWLRQQGLG